MDRLKGSTGTVPVATAAEAFLVSAAAYAANGLLGKGIAPGRYATATGG